MDDKLKFAAIHADYDAFHIFVAYGWDRMDTEDKTLGEIKVMKQLLAMKATVNTRCVDNSTPLYQAVLRQADGIVEFLLENKADMRVGRYDDRTPIGLAYIEECGKPTFSMCRMFMMCGAKPNEFYREHGDYGYGLDEEIEKFVRRIETARKSTLAFLSLRKKSHLLKLVRKDILKHVAKLVWETRGRTAWNRFDIN